MNNLDSQKDNFNKILSILCDGVERAISENKIIELQYKQKLLAISSFLEFVQAGADIRMEIGDDGKPKFIVNM